MIWLGVGSGSIVLCKDSRYCAIWHAKLWRVVGKGLLAWLAAHLSRWSSGVLAQT